MSERDLPKHTFFLYFKTVGEAGTQALHIMNLLHNLYNLFFTEYRTEKAAVQVYILSSHFNTVTF
jgi:hypothetical protein